MIREQRYGVWRYSPVRRKGSTEIEVWYVPAILPSDGRLQVDEQNPQNDGWQTDALI